MLIENVLYLSIYKRKRVENIFKKQFLLDFYRFLTAINFSTIPPAEKI